jgi:hypothetical protein
LEKLKVLRLAFKLDEKIRVQEVVVVEEVLYGKKWTSNGASGDIFVHESTETTSNYGNVFLKELLQLLLPLTLAIFRPI